MNTNQLAAKNKEAFEKAYASLNTEQKKAVDTTEGPVVVQAGPGTGKTQILTLRIANIINTHGADTAENILALTFTNAGVTAMRKRLAGVMGSEAYRVNIYTFHSFAEHVLQEYAEYFEGFLGAAVATEAQRTMCAEQVLEKGKYSLLRPFAAPFYYVPKLLAAIDQLKRENYTPEKFEEWNEEYKKVVLDSEDAYYKRNSGENKKGDLKKDALKNYVKNLELVTFYQSYQELLNKEKLYDFTDMLLAVATELSINQELCYELQEKYQYILVDEHQDTNQSQNAIVEALANAEHLNGMPNIFTVGDEKQAIYRFAGASSENFSYFKNNYSNVEVVSLINNYRSPQNILDISDSLIESEDKLESKKQSQNTGQESGKIALSEYSSYQEELYGLANKIKKLIDSGVSAKEIAVLYRENKHSVEIKNALAQNEVLAVVMARENILNKPAIVSVIQMLKVVHNLHDNQTLAKLLYSPFLNFDVYDVSKVVERFTRNKRNSATGTKHLFAVISDEKMLKEAKIETPEQFLNFAAVLKNIVSELEKSSLSMAVAMLSHESTYMNWLLASHQAQDNLRMYDTFLSEIKKLEAQTNTKYTLANFIQYLEQLERYGKTLDSTVSEQAEGVRLLTAHGAKGLEYVHVFITNFVNKVWGNKTIRTMFVLPEGASKSSNADERRLFYVALTRAKEALCISYAKTDTEGHAREPSLFLHDLDENLIQQEEGEKLSLIALHQKPKPEAEKNILNHEFLKRMFTERKLSVTALNNYYDCPAKYLVNNLLRIPSGYARALSYGSSMHKALELFFTKAAQDQKIPTEKVLLKFFTEGLSEQYLEESEFEVLHDKGVESLSAYYKNYHKSFSIKIKTEERINGVELELENNAKITLTGVLDKLEFTDDSFEVNVVDYKTGKTFSEKTKDQKEALERQLVFYALLLRLYRGGALKLQNAVLDFVEPNKKGNLEQHTLSPTDTDVQHLVSEIQQMHNEITTDSNFIEKCCKKPDCEACTTLSIILG